MNKFLISLVLLLSLNRVIGQDTLVLADGTELIGKVIEVEESAIRYRKASLPDGPIYSIESSRVFMICYHGGIRETIRKGKETVTASAIITPASSNPGNSTNEKALAAVERKFMDPEGQWEAFLMEIKPDISKNKKWLIVRGKILLNRNGNYFTELEYVVSQKRGWLPGSPASDKSYITNSSIFFYVASGKPMSTFMFEKYENAGGEGYGWTIPIDFLQPVMKDCHFYHFTKKNILVDITARQAIPFLLSDCSSPEGRILSAATTWIKYNLLNK